MIDRQALVAEAQHMGLKATPQEVKDELQHGRYAANLFSRRQLLLGEAEYQGLLQQHNLTPAIFEDGVGKEILISKLQALITGSASVSDDAIRKEFEKQNTKVKFEYAVLKEDDLKKGLHPTDEELKAYYDSHQKNYANSDSGKAQGEVCGDGYGKDCQRGAGNTRRVADLLQPASRPVSRARAGQGQPHLIKTPLPGADGKVDEKGVAEAQHRAEELLKQLQSGAKFEDVAKKYSEDPGSAKEGGSLGWIGKGQTVPEFEKAAFCAAQGTDQRRGEESATASTLFASTTSRTRT